MKNLFREYKNKLLSTRDETVDILKDIYGSQLDADYNFVDKVSSPPEETPVQTKSYVSWPAGPPFGLGVSVGSTYTSYGLIQMGKMNNYGNLLFPNVNPVSEKAYLRFKSSLCYKILNNDLFKVVKSSDLFDVSDGSSAIKFNPISKIHPPVYLRAQSKADDSSIENHTSLQLLDTPIDELFRKIIDTEDVEADEKKSSIEEMDLDNQGELWIDKYKPMYFSDLLSDERVNREALTWLNSWKNLSQRGDEPRVLILGGPPGVGKSTLVQVIAKHANFKVVEINASDDRTKDRIIPIVTSISTTHSATGQLNLCLLEEIDGLASGEEQVVSALVSLIQKRTKTDGYKVKRPIICTCNDLYNKNLLKLRQVAKILYVNPPDELTLLERLQFILSNESIVIDPLMLSALINLYREDIRSCISALDYYTRDYKKTKNFDLHLQEVLDSFKDQSSRFDEFVRLTFSLSKRDGSIGTVTDNVLRVLSTGQVNPNFNTMAALLDDHLLKLSYNDPNMSNTSYIMDLLAQSDVINRKVMSNPSCANLLAPYLATVNMIRPLQSNTFTNIIYPSQSIHNIGFHRRNTSQSIIKTLQANIIPQLGVQINNLSFITDVLPFVVLMLRPRECLQNCDWSDLGKFFKNVNVVQEMLGITNSPPAIKQLIQIVRILNLYGIHISKVQSGDNITGEFHMDPDLTVLQLESWSPNYKPQPFFRTGSMEKVEFNGWKIDSPICESLNKVLEWVDNAWFHQIIRMSKMGVKIAPNIKNAILDSYINGPQLLPSYSMSTNPSITIQSSISTRRDDIIDAITQPTFKDLLEEHMDMVKHLRELKFDSTSGVYKYVLENSTSVNHIVNNFNELFIQ